MKIKDIVNREIVNLKNCDQEPIHIPGSIQPHGFLLALNKHTFEILFCSENSVDFIGLSHHQLLGKNCTDIFGETFTGELKTCEAFKDGLSKTFKILFSTKELELVVHVNGEHLIIESEEDINTHDTEKENDFFNLSKEFFGYMEDTHTLKELCKLVAEGIKKITGYDRVMIYHFDKDYNGEVIAESKREDLESFLGLHYPHTDIPVQARELYIKNLLRIIVDVNYKPVPLYTFDNGPDKTLDLSYSVLRSVSPIHIQYLHNMGVGATLTISLIHKKKLWGLISCHHYSAKYLSHEVRSAAKLQGHFITSQIEVRQLNEEYESSKIVNEATKELISRKFDLNRHSIKLLVDDPNTLLLCNASGVSIIIDGLVYKTGLTPGDEEIKKLSVAVSAYSKHTPVATDSLAALFPEFKTIIEVTPGINYYPLGNDNCIIWYRTETISEINWAGDPSKAIEKDKGGLSPRKSFELWKETVKGRSNLWLQPELNTSSNFANVLQKHLSSIFLAEEEEKQRELAHILTETNAELENINWISTHDLQEPLRKIQMMSSYLLSEDDRDLPGHVYETVSKMNKSAERMQSLVKDILKYTRLNNSKEAFETIDLNVLLNEILTDLNDSLNEKSAALTWGTLPVIQGIPFLLKQLFSNLIYNSLKFSSPGRIPEITVSATLSTAGNNANSDQKDAFHLIKYSDNGIGFEKAYNESIFNIFTRLHAISEYQGSGIGLALCKKIMNTHKGSIKADGHLGEGVDFYLYFPVIKL